MTTANATGNLSLGIQTSSADSALDTLLAKIQEVRSALSEMNSALPTDALSASLAEQRQAMRTLTTEIEQSANQQAQTIERTNRRIMASYRETLGKGFTVSYKVDEASLRAAAFGPTREMFQKAQAEQEKTLAKMLVAQQEFLAKKESLEQEATLRHQQMMLESSLNDQQMLDQMLAKQQALLAGKEAAEREAEHQHRQIMLESALKDAEVERQRTEDAEREAYARLQSEATFLNRMYDLQERQAERQRVLNAQFAVASPQSRLSTARVAQAYSDLGGDAAARYGAEAAAMANAEGIAALTKEIDLNSAAARLNAGMTRNEAQAMNEAHAAARGLAGGFGALWTTYGAIIPLLGGFALAAGIKSAVTGFADVQYQMTFVKELAGETTLTVKDLTDQMHEVSIALGISPEKAGQGLRILAQAGLDAKQALSALPDIFKLATVGELDMGTAANAVIGVMNAYSLSTASVSHIGDVMAKAGAMSATSVASMTQSMKIASPVAAQFGVTLEETATALTALAKVNITGTMAGTALKNMIQEMAAPQSSSNRKILKMLGFDAYDAKGELKPLLDQIEELRVKLEPFDRKSQGALITALFGAKGEKAFFALLKQAGDAGRQMQEDLTNSDGFVGNVFMKLQMTAKGELDKVKATLTNTLSEVGEEAQGPVTRLLSTLRGLLTLQPVKDALIGLTQSLITLASAAITVGGPLLAVWGIFKTSNILAVGIASAATSMAELSKAMRGAATASEFLTATLGANPYLKLISVLITVVGLYYALRTAKDSVMENAGAEVKNIYDETEALKQQNVQLAQKVSLMRQGRNEKQADAELEARKADDAVTQLQKKLDDLKKGNTATPINFNPGVNGGLSGIDNSVALQDDEIKRTQDLLNAAKDQAQKYREAADENAKLIKQINDERTKQDQESMNQLMKTLKAGTKTFDPDAMKGQNARINDIYRAAQARLDGQLQAMQDYQKAMAAANKASNATGSLGDLQLIDAQRDATINALTEEMNIYKQKEDLAAKAQNRRRDETAIQNKQASTDRAIIQATVTAAQQRQAVIDKANDEVLAHEKEVMKDRGQLQAAFLADFDAKYGTEIKRLNADLTNTNLNPASRDVLQKKLGMLTDERKTGSQNAQFAELKNKFDQEYRQMQEQLSQLGTGSKDGISSASNFAVMASDIRQKAEPAMRELLQQMVALANASGSSKMKSEVAKLGKDLASEAHKQIDLWKNVGQSIGASLSDAFGRGGKFLGAMVESLTKYGAAQLEINDKLKQSTDGKDPNSPEYIKAASQARKESTDLQIQTYGDLAGAMKGYFGEHTAGFKMMEAIERGFRLVQIALTLEDMYTKLAANTTVVTATVLGDQTKAASAETSAGSIIAAAVAEANASAVAGVANQAQGDPYTAFARMAVMAAIMAGLGLVVGGGFSSGTDYSNIAADRQKKQGTGTVLGSENEKSDSIAESLKYIKNDSNIALRYQQGMLRSLENINDGIAGLGKFVAEAGGLQGTQLDIKAGGFGSYSSSFFGFNKSSKELVDSGLTANGLWANLGALMSGGSYNLSKYQDVHEERSSFFGLFKSSNDYRNLSPVSAELSRQVGLVLSGMGDAIQQAGVALGKNEADMVRRVSGENIRLGDISFKGMNADEVNKALQAEFSHVGDLMAKDILPGFEKFQQAGEGYLQTVIRVATATESARFKLEQVGVTMIDLSQLRKTTGDTETELVRESLERQQTVVTGYRQVFIPFIGWMNLTQTKLTGIGEILQDMDGTASDLTATYAQLIDVQEKMKESGANGDNLNRDTIRGAGTLDRLQQGLEDYQSNFFTDTEQAQMKLRSLQAEFQRAGIAMPTSMESFKQLVTFYGNLGPQYQQTYGKLIALSGDFAEVFKENEGVITKAKEDALSANQDYANSLADSVKRFYDVFTKATDLGASIDATLSGGSVSPDTQIQSLKYKLQYNMTVDQQIDMETRLNQLITDRYNTEKDAAQKMLDFGKQLQEYVNGLTLGDLSPLNNQQKLAQAQQEYQDTLVAARAGDTTAQGNLQGKADAYLKLAKDFYASSGQYTAIFDDVYASLKTLAVTSTASGQAAMQAAVDKQTADLEALRAEVSATGQMANTLYQQQLNVLWQTLTVEQQQAAALGKLSVVPDILSNLPGDIAYRLDSLYANIGTYTGTNPPINGSHASGLAYVPFDGYVAKLHKGERVLTASQASQREAALVAAVEALQEEVRQLREDQAKHTGALLQAQYDSTDRAAGKVVDGQMEAADNSAWKEKSKPKVV